ncbi:nucleotidyl transferase AbiEii/AbiGii toxin family protein [Scytonema sp. UIC 10036]|uniref:nucleotidyl transferase AbiEii/AbiGii toxin family protein n=1 Tax=Scytonema sp. UIC 10036 TaxID=2304196 RepID=UPI0012DAE7E7|nr:nucleotidyl transferase AbiEii/AbiGii toxin family protein [Scytonema sp. UIC 10036]MUH01138.1 nucleotidyl transferase AbiEii/AbiGii toxin family protein [Scytonema sp. UIC 10036]
MKLIETISQRSDRPLDEILIYHLLESLLRRVAYSVHAKDLVLRGGMLTRLWVPPGYRIAVDVDFVGLYPFGIESTEQRFRELLATDGFTDGVVFHLESLESQGIWMEDPFPGVRLRLDASVLDYRQRLQIDVGFNDPLVPEQQWIQYPTLVPAEPVKLQAARPELMAGWKLHGLIELGAKRWRGKDLYDLMLLATLVPLDKALLPEAIRVAFSSHNANLEEVQIILTNPHWWNTGKNRRNWRYYCRQVPTQIMPEDFLNVVTTVISYWGPIINNLCHYKNATNALDKLYLPNLS